MYAYDKVKREAEDSVELAETLEKLKAKVMS
jgi:hypothetical protein